MVTTLYAGPLPCAWWQNHSNRASSLLASVGIHSSRNADSNSSSDAPLT